MLTELNGEEASASDLDWRPAVVEIFVRFFSCLWDQRDVNPTSRRPYYLDSVAHVSLLCRNASARKRPSSRPPCFPPTSSSCPNVWKPIWTKVSLLPPFVFPQTQNADRTYVCQPIQPAARAASRSSFGYTLTSRDGAFSAGASSGTSSLKRNITFSNNLGLQRVE